MTGMASTGAVPAAPAGTTGTTGTGAAARSDAPGPPRAAASVGADLRLVAVPWLLTRLLTFGSLAVSRRLWTEVGSGARPSALAQGLFAFDGAFYRDIAAGGYDAVPHAGLRFFPLFPLLGRWLSAPFGAAPGAALLVVVAVASFVFLVLLARLVRFETGDDDLARRAVWLACLVPPAIVMVLGYSEALLMALAVAAFLALRTRRWAAAAAAGYLAGLARPLGVLLSVPAAVEAVKAWPGAGPGARARSGAAVLAPVAGLFTYLAWVGGRTGDLLDPLRIQESPDLRGGFSDPASTLWRAARALVGGDEVGTGLHLPWALLFIVVLVVVARRLPASYTAFAAAGLLVALSGHNIDSLERYALTAFPIVIGGAALLERPAVERTVLVAAAAAFVGYGTLTFLGAFVP